MNTEGRVPSGVGIDSGAEDALILRPQADVEVRLLPPGAAIFIEGLASGRTVAEAAEVASAGDDRFELTAALVGLMETQALVDFTISCNDGRAPPMMPIDFHPACGATGCVVETRSKLDRIPNGSLR